MFHSIIGPAQRFKLKHILPDCHYIRPRRPRPGAPVALQQSRIPLAWTWHYICGRDGSKAKNLLKKISGFSRIPY